MTGKPKSMRHAVLAALYCKHPELDAGHVAALVCLATNGDMTGKNCRPGNVNLVAATKLAKRMMQYKLGELQGWKLITRTKRGDGRKNASVYEIHFGNPHFPDRAPGGNEEWLIDEPTNDIEANRATAVAQLTDQPRNQHAETAQRDPENRAMEVPKPRNSYCDTPSTHQPHTKNTPTPTAPQTGAASKSVCEDSWAQLLAALPQQMRAATFGKGDKAELQQHLNTHGALKVAGTIRAWWGEVAREMDGYRNRWRACLDVLPGWLLKADEYGRDEAERQWQESPACKAAHAARQAQIIKAAQEEMGRAYGADQPPAPEVPEDFDWLAGVE